MSYGRLIKVTEKSEGGLLETIYVVAVESHSAAVQMVAAKHPPPATVEDIGHASEQLVKVLDVPPGECRRT